MLFDASFVLNKNNSMRVSHIFKKMYGFTLSMVLLMGSSLSYGDGLFDFQMKLAEKGNAEAEFKIGEMYETGFGVKKDQKQAEIWIKKAASQGHETAGFKLLYWDIRKNGLKGENKKKFADLRTKAADGNAQAMYYVGSMYSHGVGVKKNYDKALDWLNKATYVGVLEAEREAILVREMKQKSLVKSRKAEEKRKAKAKAAEEEKKKAEAERKIAEEKKAKAEAESKKKKQQADKQSAEKKELAAQKDKAAESARLTEEAKEKEEAEAKEEKRKQAWLKKRKAEQDKKKARESKFESDPCKGKSARFLSTCR